MNALEMLHSIYKNKGAVDLKAIQKLFDEAGYRVGLPNGVIASTLDDRLALMLLSYGGELLKNEKEVMVHKSRHREG